MPPSGKNVPTLVERALLAEVEEEMRRRGWEGSRVGFISEVLTIGLMGSRQLPPARREDRVAQIFKGVK